MFSIACGSDCTGGVNDVGRLKSGIAFLPYGRFGVEAGGGGGGGGGAAALAPANARTRDEKIVNDFMAGVFDASWR